MKKLLITGASGFFGWNLCQLANDDWQIFGIVNTHSFRQENIQIVSLDLTQYQDLKRVISEVKPDCVIHAAAISDANQCEKYPEVSYKVNVTATANLAGLCSDLGVPAAFISTDLIFNGTSPPYSENDQPNPVNRYGEQKAQAELEIESRYPAMTIARLPLMYGVRGPFSHNFFEGFLKQMQSGNELKLFTDEYRSLVDVASAIEGVFLALDQFQGKIHLGGHQSVSRYEFGEMMAEVFEIDDPKIIPTRQSDIPMAAARPANVSLDSSKAFAAGYDPLSPAEGIQRVRDQLVK